MPPRPDLAPEPLATREADIKTYKMVERSERLDFEIRDQSGRPPVFTPHRHEFFQIFANVEGDFCHEIGGHRREHPPHSLVFVLPYRVHVAKHDAAARYRVVNFASNFLRPDFALGSLEMEEASITLHPELAPFIYENWIDFVFDPAEFAHIEAVLDRLDALNRRRRLGTLERIRGGLLELIGFTTERYAEQLQSMSEGRVYLQGRTAALGRVLKFIDDNLQRDLSLNEAAEAAFLSPSYLSQLLKKQTGQAFVEWLTGRRLDGARDRLARTEDRIYTVAAAVGFSDEAYFTRRFRQRFGMSPSAYRKSMRDVG